MTTFGFVIDNRKCIGCHACTVACKSEHQVPLGVDRTWVKYVEKGEFPNNRRLFSVMRCNHCDNAPCVTICPVTALYRRDDGIVDFNNERCIGCKACLQACPYDSLYIDPATDTAAKCNFCTHRLENGLEPSCVVVCPEQAIIAGDLDNPQSEISQLIDRHPVQVRKPEKGTRPKLFYIEGDAASLIPSQTAAGRDTMWSSSPEPEGNGWATDGHPPASGSDEQLLPVISQMPARRVYDVRPRPPAWGLAVVGYTWSKSIAAGAFLAVGARQLILGPSRFDGIATALVAIALLFLLVTTVLLIADLKQPKRFLYVLLRPQWKSWLVRGAYVLVAYGGVLTAWLIARLSGEELIAQLLLWPGVILAGLAAVYTAFLLAQSKGRDFWQNPLLSIHLLVHALLAGSAVWLMAERIEGSAGSARPVFLGMLVVSLLTMLGEILTVPPTADARRAAEMIVRGPFGGRFWLGGVLIGHLLPLALLVNVGHSAVFPAAALALAGLYVIERLWILAPQRVPLS